MKRRKNVYFITGGILSAVLTLIIIVGLFWTPYSTTGMNAKEKMHPPSLTHILGTDNFGRDVFSRVMEGAGTSFMIAVLVVLIGCVFGILIGSLCGYFGGIADMILMHICDTITAFPAILLALVIISITGGGAFNIILALGILFIPSFARVVRTEYQVRPADGRPHPEDPVCPHSAEYTAGSDPRSHDRIQQCSACRSEHELSGHRHPASPGQSGIHAEGQSELSEFRPVVCARNRPCHRPADPGILPAERRCAAGKSKGIKQYESS